MAAILLNGQPLGAEADVARGFWRRLLGLMGRRRPADGRGLYLPACRAVHTGFMRFPLDLCFLDSNGRVTRLCRGVKPWRARWGDRTTAAVLEMPAGSVGAECLRVGDILAVVHASLPHRHAPAREGVRGARPEPRA
jgi:uncharacterized membrane protein (UPF0127 family)